MKSHSKKKHTKIEYRKFHMEWEAEFCWSDGLVSYQDSDLTLTPIHNHLTAVFTINFIDSKNHERGIYLIENLWHV